MKKIFTFLICCLYMETLFGQILVRNENWPNTDWTVSGTYTPQALVSNPRLTANFSYDTSLVTPAGALTTLSVISPYFSLKPAFDGGEKNLKITFNVAYTTFAPDVLYVQYWDADTNSWIDYLGGSAPVASLGNYQTCTFDPIGSHVEGYLDYSSFSTNKLQNFRYRFFVNGTSSKIAGVCVNSVSLNSLSCEAPTNLFLLEVTSNQATINWDDNSSGMQFWDIEYGLEGFVQGTGTMEQTESVPLTPFTIFGLTPNTAYHVYVRKNCAGFNGDVHSEWIGPLSFTTSSLGFDEFKLQGIQLFPNPTRGVVELNALDAVNEIKLYDMNGRELINMKSKKNNLTLDLSSFTDGLYLLKIETDKGSGLYKLIKY